MKAYLYSARIAPKKANLIASLVRGMTVEEALTQLEKTNKKGARFLEELIASAAANAVHNDKQVRSQLRIDSIVVNQGMGLRRGVPMARGRIRPMRKFMSHIEVTLGLLTDDVSSKKNVKLGSKASHGAKSQVQESGSAAKKAPVAKTAAAKTTKKSSSSSSK
jgi:large subunit ribosomal protein L22